MCRRSAISSIRVRMMSGTKRWMRECEEPRRGFAWVERNRCREAIRVRKGHTPMRSKDKEVLGLARIEQLLVVKMRQSRQRKKLPNKTPCSQCFVVQSHKVDCLNISFLPSQPDAHLLKSQPEPSDSKPRSQSRSSDSSCSTS
jgi:hypothetical protein